jgi:hypothetical protein
VAVGIGFQVQPSVIAVGKYPYLIALTVLLHLVPEAPGVGHRHVRIEFAELTEDGQVILAIRLEIGS